MHAKFITILILYTFLVQAVLFWTLDGLCLCSLAPLLVYTTLAYPLAHSDSSGHAVVQISWTHRTTESSTSPCKMGQLLIAVRFPRGMGSLQPGCPLHPLGLSPKGIRQANPLFSPPCLQDTISSVLYPPFPVSSNQI